LLDALGVPMESKPFAVGVRIEHPQALIDGAQYGGFAGQPALPPADYKLNIRTPDGRGAYTFCMCPGGEVINASSEEGRLNLNGMSFRARGGENANAALLVGVKPSDFGGPMEGIAFQRKIEEAAFSVNGGYLAPCQRAEKYGPATARAPCRATSRASCLLSWRTTCAMRCRCWISACGASACPTRCSPRPKPVPRRPCASCVTRGGKAPCAACTRWARARATRAESYPRLWTA
jgi:hypothetical protein